MFYSIMKFILAGIAWVDMILATLLLYLLSFLPSQWTTTWYPKLFRGWCWIFIRALGVELRCHQKNRFPLPKQFIVIGNHPSVFEDLGMPALFPAHFLAKEQMKDWWILGRISIATQTLFVKRESRESRHHAKEEIIEVLNKGENVGIYPEGGCKGRRIHLPFLNGAFEAALKTGIPIIPVFLHYEAQADFEWGPNETLIQKLWKIANSQNKVAHYYVFDAIEPKQFNNIDTLRIAVESLYLQWQAKYLE